MVFEENMRTLSNLYCGQLQEEPAAWTRNEEQLFHGDLLPEEAEHQNLGQPGPVRECKDNREGWRQS